MDCLVCQLSTLCFDVQGIAFSNIRLKALCACISSVTYAFASRQTFVLTSENTPAVFTCLCQVVHSLLWMVSYGLSCLPAFYFVLWCSRYCFQQYTVESFVRMYQLSDLCFRVTPDICIYIGKYSLQSSHVFVNLCIVCYGWSAMDCLVCQLSTLCFDVQGIAFSNIRLKALCACISSVTYAFASRQTFVLTSENTPAVFTCLCQLVDWPLWMVSYGLSCLPAFYLVLWCSRYCFQQYTVESFVRMYQLSDLCFRVTPDFCTYIRK